MTSMKVCVLKKSKGGFWPSGKSTNNCTVKTNLLFPVSIQWLTFPNCLKARANLYRMHLQHISESTDIWPVPFIKPLAKSTVGLHWRSQIQKMQASSLFSVYSPESLANKSPLQQWAFLFDEAKGHPAFLVVHHYICMHNRICSYVLGLGEL